MRSTEMAPHSGPLPSIAGGSSTIPTQRRVSTLGTRRLHLVLVTSLAALVGSVAPTSPLRAEDATASARRLLLAGKYAEAAEAYEALAASAPVPAAIGLARTHAETGKRDEAAAVLQRAITKNPQSAPLLAEAARLQLDRGDLAAADKSSVAALAIDDQQLLARYIRAELHCRAGRLQDANAAYKWFVKYYNAHDVKDAESLDCIGLAAAQYARWNRLKDQFSFLVNELYPEALKIEPAWWRAHYQAGLLYLEKYNQAEASRELKAALELNPSAACVHAALGRLALQNYELSAAKESVERALEINPADFDAQLVRGDILLANFQAAEAIAIFEQACHLRPGCEESEGRLAAAYAVVDGLPPDLSGTRTGAAIDRATKRNEHCGEFFASLASALDESRKYPAAARFYRQAVERMPQLVPPHGELGLVLMRLGEEGEARRTLSEAFKIDPFNVRVNNTLKVLDVLDNYATIETDHFIVRFDRAQDEILARYSADYLEEVYPELCRKFGFEPEGKSLFEIFNRAKNTGGHGWFSARMVGLPFVHTVGACAGKIVALASPNDMPQKFNWARVLKHEFVHVLNLQQTDFSIPHWFTEALAVGSEGYDRPEQWNQLLVERVPKDQLFNLDTINLGFVRPQSSLDWHMAYCQADLYAQYLTTTYGADALAKMLAAYRDNLDTPQALRREFSVSKEDFEKGYLAYVRRITAELSARPQARTETLAELERAHTKAPDDPAVAARLAVAYLARRDYARAKPLAQSSLADPEARQLSAYVLARLELQAGEPTAALELLEQHLDRAHPDDRLLSLLAGLKLRAENYAEAAEFYELGARQNPGDAEWARSLARVYLAEGNDAKLAVILAQLARLDPDDVTIRKKLAQLALADRDYTTAARWAREALHIDVMDADIHSLLGEANMGCDKFALATDEYEVAVKLAPRMAPLQAALAGACLKADRLERGRQALAALLEIDPDNPRAAELREKLAP